LFAGTETLSLSVYEPIAIHIFAWGDRPPIWEGVELGGRKSSPSYAQCVCWSPHSIFSLLRANSHARFVCGGVSHMGERFEVGGRVYSVVFCIMYNVFALTKTLSLSLYDSRAIFSLGDRPPIWGEKEWS